jgi:hypothetical protein
MTKAFFTVVVALLTLYRSGITTRQKGETTNYRENGFLLEFILREAAGQE